MQRPKISCIFPIHNEAQFLHSQLTSFNQQTQAAGLHPGLEVILVENGSRDNSWKIIQQFHRRQYSSSQIFRLPHASYGRALKLGLDNARGQAIFIFNVDFFDINFLKTALPLLNVADIIIASKTLSASRDRRSSFRRLTTYFFNVMLRLILNYPGTDTHGIKAFKKTALLSYALERCRTRNELFDTELIIRLTRWGARLIELPISVNEIRPTRYRWHRRLAATILDLLSALWSKYLIPNFSQKVVVADDYGLSETINQEIRKLVRYRVINWVSIMANYVTKPEWLNLKSVPEPVKYSIHLNIVEGKPINPNNQVASLLNARGRFYSTRQLLIRLVTKRVNISEVTREWEAQINRLTQMGIKLTHLDSHQHSHLLPGLWPIALKLAAKYRISSVRSFDSSRYSLKTRPLRYLIFLSAVIILKKLYGANQFSTKEINEIILHPGQHLN